MMQMIMIMTCARALSAWKSVLAELEVQRFKKKKNEESIIKYHHK